MKITVSLGAISAFLTKDAAAYLSTGGDEPDYAYVRRIQENESFCEVAVSDCRGLLVCEQRSSICKNGLSKGRLDAACMHIDSEISNAKTMDMCYVGQQLCGKLVVENPICSGVEGSESMIEDVTPDSVESSVRTEMYGQKGKKGSKQAKSSKRAKKSKLENCLDLEETSTEIEGIVTSFGSGQTLPLAAVTIEFLDGTFQGSTTTDDSGFFVFDSISSLGTFILSGKSQDGTESGTAQGILTEEATTSVDLVLDVPGDGFLTGNVTLESTGEQAASAVVTYFFPETQRTGSTTTDERGGYLFENVPTDGVVTIYAFDFQTATSASVSSIFGGGLLTVDLQLQSVDVIQPELVNGNFLNNLEGWVVEGPARILSQEEVFAEPPLRRRRLELTCPSINAVLISTVGDSVNFASISQTFIVPEGGENLEGRLLFLSDEWPAFFGSMFNDNYVALLTTSAGTTVFSSNNLNSAAWTDGVLFNGRTPVVEFSVPISSFVGQPVTLRLEVNDIGDSIVDSGVAVTDIRVTGSNDEILTCNELIEECVQTGCDLLPKCQNPVRDTCNFYNECLESGYECGAAGYPIGFGDKFCKIFVELEPKLSLPGQEWSSDVRLCLQKALVDPLSKENRESTSCQQLQSFAFDTHVPCYLNTGFCSKLSLVDRARILWATKSAAFTLGFYEQLVGVGSGCVVQWSNEATDWLFEVGFKVGYEILRNLVGGSVTALQDYIEDAIKKFQDSIKELLPSTPPSWGDDIFIWDIFSGSTKVQVLIIDNPSVGFLAKDFIEVFVAALAADENGVLLNKGLVLESWQFCNGEECQAIISQNPNIADPYILATSEECNEYSGCDAIDSRRVAVCQTECGNYRTLCITPEEVEGHLEIYPDTCGCCDPSKEPAGPDYCSSFV